MTVRMRHKGLPKGQEIEIPEISVRTYKRAGWTVVGDEPSGAGSAETDAAEARSRRRTTKEDS